LADFQRDMDLWIQRFKATTPLNPNQPVIVPGEPELAQYAYRQTHGIPLVDAVITDLTAVGEALKHPFNP
jgi:LDH2 family malate/lactate/ureidoglycolate dehydrogenase